LKLPEDSPLRKQVMRIGAAAQEAADVIQDLLTLARRGRYEMKPTDLNQVIEANLDSPGYLSLKGERPGIVLDLKLRRDIAPIHGSSVHLGKVVMNLVINAFDAIGGKGTVTIQTEQQSIARLLCGYENVRQGEYVALRVRDTGIGIDPSDIDKIFEPYFSKKKMGRSGSGLGLSVVYGIVKDHKGYYDVVSEIGKGTEFIIYFPVATTVEPVTPEVDRDYRGQEEVLVVDDSEEQLELAKELISSFGYRIVTSRNGHEAIDYLRNHRVDLVVLDMIMERNFDGLDTYREIVKIHPGQRAIIASGFSPTKRVVEMRELGAGEYVKKPYTREAIGKAVRAELDRRRPTAIHSGLV
jgi:two-component system cell cycle sensor histidine kinase/response regulator CckA